MHEKRKNKPVECARVAWQRIKPRQIKVQQVIARKRKQIITDINRDSDLVMVARAMQMNRNDATYFPCTNGGDVARDFAEQRKPLLEKTLRAHVENLRKNCEWEEKG